MCVCRWTTGRLSESQRLFFSRTAGRTGATLDLFSRTIEKWGRTLEPWCISKSNASLCAVLTLTFVNFADVFCQSYSKFSP